MNILKADLLSAVDTYRRELEAAGIAVHDVRFDEGSKTYGVAFRLYIITEEKGVTPAPGTAGGYLGWTKREAYDTLWTIIRTLSDVRYFSKEG